MKKKALSLVLALAMCLSLIPMQAFADESTTTINDAGPDKLPNTEIYTVTGEAGSDYPYYGAKHEPRVGVYYGRTCASGTKTNGQYGLVNESQFADESAVGFYYAVADPQSLEYWNYMYGPVVNDGSRAFLVYINFARGAADCAAYAAGQYDSALTSAFSYLSTLSNPVFVRIGGEMNDWYNLDAQAYISAFRHVADLAHRTAPNVATVFSPNFTSGFKMDMDSFYPGDAYVDWIGVSLYYNARLNAGVEETDKNYRFFGRGPYGDALLNVQQGVNLSRLHKKPLMATEGGSANISNGQDISAEAAARMEKAFAFLPMVYPELKCIITSDYNAPESPNSYQFYNNSTVTSAYRKAVANNPTYLDKVGGDASYYTKLSAFHGTWTGKMQFAAYTYTPIGNKPTATWSVDGQDRATVSEYPYAFELDVGSLGAGEHTLTVTFSNGQSKSYAFTANSAGTRPAASFSFDDVPAGEYYAEPVKWAVEQAITNGTSATTFSPDQLCTEPQILTFLWRAAGQPASTAQLPFTLDPSLSYAEGALRWASEKYMIGSGFNQTAYCTRAQAVYYIWAAKGGFDVAYNGQFTDLPATPVYVQAVAWAVNAGVTDGTSPTTFSPNATCTRGQIVTFLHRAYK